MNAVSAILNYGLSLDQQWWNNHDNMIEFENLIDSAKAFDKFTDQPECESKEKIKEIQKICPEFDFGE